MSSCAQKFEQLTFEKKKPTSCILPAAQLFSHNCLLTSSHSSRHCSSWWFPPSKLSIVTQKSEYWKSDNQHGAIISVLRISISDGNFCTNNAISSGSAVINPERTVTKVKECGCSGFLSRRNSLTNIAALRLWVLVWFKKEKEKGFVHFSVAILRTGVRGKREKTHKHKQNKAKQKERESNNKPTHTTNQPIKQFEFAGDSLCANN